MPQAGLILDCCQLIFYTTPLTLISLTALTPNNFIWLVFIKEVSRQLEPNPGPSRLESTLQTTRHPPQPQLPLRPFQSCLTQMTLPWYVMHPPMGLGKNLKQSNGHKSEQSFDFLIAAPYVSKRIPSQALSWPIALQFKINDMNWCARNVAQLLINLKQVAWHQGQGDLLGIPSNMGLDPPITKV